MPELHNLFMLIQGVLIEIPAPKLDYLAGFYPNPAEIMFPMITSSTS